MKNRLKIRQATARSKKAAPINREAFICKEKAFLGDSHFISNPWVQDLAKAILLLAEGKNEEVVQLMKKWARK